MYHAAEEISAAISAAARQMKLDLVVIVRFMNSDSPKQIWVVLLIL